jgi:hypothetical protein
VKRVLTGWLVGLCLLALCADEDASAWARQLGSPGQEIRDRAELRLMALGSEAKEAVQQAMASKDPEIRARARRVWNHIRWGDAEGFAPTAMRLLREYQAGKGKPVEVRRFVEMSGVEVLQAVPPLLEEDAAAGKPLAKAIVLHAVSRYESKALARQILKAGTACTAPFPEIAADASPKRVVKLLDTLNLAWQHELAATVGLRALRSHPGDEDLLARTFLAVRAGGDADKLWRWLGRRDLNRAQFVLMAHFADEFGKEAEFIERLQRGFPDGLEEADLAFLSDFLAREGAPGMAADLLKRATTAKLRYRRSRLLLMQGDREGAAAEWQIALAKLDGPDTIYSLADHMDTIGDSRSELLWRQLLGEGKGQGIYASNACFRLAAICQGRGDWGEAADFYERGLACKQGALLMQVNGECLSQDQAVERIQRMVRELRAKDKRETR